MAMNPPNQQVAANVAIAEVARYLNSSLRPDGLLDTQDTTSKAYPYCLVTVRLVPGGLASKIMACIDNVLTTLGGLRIHSGPLDGVYLIRFERQGNARAEATLIWEQLMLACTGDQTTQGHLWRRGDAAYVHFPDDTVGIGMLGAVIVNNGDKLPQP